MFRRRHERALESNHIDDNTCPLVDRVTMSTTLTKGGSASAQPPVSKAVVSPVPILDNPVAAAVSLVHPVLLSGLFAWRFGALVADPASTLQTALPVVVAVQVVYAVLCLPIAGSQNGKTSRKTRPGEKKKSSSSDSSAPNPVVVCTNSTESN